ncbi:hypothetical protein BOTNAR_0122g00180 [Botryotinia narcissicola]|uniref:Uncharacterized protein n=1 Tax=Botryotinia narcissicola TaxID=278944 RepID=A0A4Z1IKH6_9HELO|nr:hypothetical protein BOTNAR_0122g00180 [Botryotinia narcissicola]
MSASMNSAAQNYLTGTADFSVGLVEAFCLVVVSTKTSQFSDLSITSTTPISGHRLALRYSLLYTSEKYINYGNRCSEDKLRYDDSLAMNQLKDVSKHVGLFLCLGRLIVTLKGVTKPPELDGIRHGERNRTDVAVLENSIQKFIDGIPKSPTDISSLTKLEFGIICDLMNNWETLEPKIPYFPHKARLAIVKRISSIDDDRLFARLLPSFFSGGTAKPMMDVMRRRRGSECLISIAETYIKECKSFDGQSVAIRWFERFYKESEWSYAQYKRIVSSSLQVRSKDCCVVSFWKAEDNIEILLPAIQRENNATMIVTFLGLLATSKDYWKEQSFDVIFRKALPGIIDDIDLGWTETGCMDYTGLASIIYIAYNMDMLSEVKVILENISTKIQDACKCFYIEHLLPFTRELMKLFQKCSPKTLHSSQVRQFAHKVINSWILKFRPTKPTSLSWIQGFDGCSIQQCSWCKPLQEFLLDPIKQKTTIWMFNTGNDKGHLQHLTDHLRSNEISHSAEYSKDKSVELSLRKLSAQPKAVHRKYNEAFQNVQGKIKALGRESLQLFLGEQFESVLELDPVEPEIPSVAQSSAGNGSSLRLRGQRNTRACSFGSHGGAATSSTEQNDVSGVPATLDKTPSQEKHANNKRASESEISNIRDDPIVTGTRRKRTRKSQN